MPRDRGANRAGLALAQPVLALLAMTKDEAWTIPFIIVLWTTFLVAFIMVIVVVMMH